MSKHRVDASDSSCVAVCGMCGARFLTAAGTLHGWTALASHERLAHPGTVTASKRLHDATRRTVL